MGSWRTTIVAFGVAITFFILAAGTLVLQGQVDWLNAWVAEGLFATLVTIAAGASLYAADSLRRISKTSETIDEVIARSEDDGNGQFFQKPDVVQPDQLAAAERLLKEVRKSAQEQREGIAEAQDRVIELMRDVDKTINETVSRELAKWLGPTFQDRGDIPGRLESAEQKLDEIERTMVSQFERLEQRIDELD